MFVFALHTKSILRSALQLIEPALWESVAGSWSSSPAFSPSPCCLSPFGSRSRLVSAALDRNHSCLGCCCVVHSGVLPPNSYLQIVQEYERTVIFRLGRITGKKAKGPGRCCQIWNVCLNIQMNQLNLCGVTENVGVTHHITNTHVQGLAPLTEALTGLLGFHSLLDLLKALIVLATTNYKLVLVYMMGGFTPFGLDWSIKSQLFLLGMLWI